MKKNHKKHQNEKKKKKKKKSRKWHKPQPFNTFPAFMIVLYLISHSYKSAENSC